MPKNSIKIKPKDEANGLKRTRIRRRWTSSGRESGKRLSQVVLKEERRALEEEVLKELKEEVSKDVISGYSFSEADNDVVNKLVNKMTKSKGLEVAAVDKKNVVMDCPSTEVALVVAVLLRVEILDSRVAGY